MSYTSWLEAQLDVRSVGYGEELTALCPFHDDHTPSFRINGRTGLFICHACGEKGDIRKLSRHLRQGTPVRDIQLDQVKRQIKRLASEQIDYYPESYLLRFGFSDPSGYWSERGFTEETQFEWDLGYDPQFKHHTIPIRDSVGHLLGVTRRQAPGERPKYKHPTGFKKRDHLFGEWRINGPEVVLCEGQLDAIMVNQVTGLPGVAVFGDAMHSNQVKLLQRHNVQVVTIAFDNDEAGRAATEVVHAQLMRAGFRVKLADWSDVPMPNDPADLGSQTPAALLDVIIGAWEVSVV